jgi:3-isopropylmalate/(R)-2-methylmalate dehydratase small subunit
VVIAISFARIFYRNAINIGLPILESAEAVEGIKAGDEVEVDLASGKITNKTTGKTFQAEPYPEFMLGIIKAGGLINHVRNKVKSKA